MNFHLKNIIALFIAIGFHCFSNAQDLAIKGQVKSENIRLAGVSVYIKGTSYGTSTNADGFYTINLPLTADSLTFKMLGYKAQTIPVQNKTYLNINLEPEDLQLSEIKINGFATETSIANLRMENIQFTPEPISAYSSKQIEDAGIDNIPNFIDAIPNTSFTSSQNIGTHSLTVRGITQLRNAEAPIAVVVDGVNIPNQSGFDMELFDVEQIELLKGPQGSLYGRNAIAGALIVTTKKPTNAFSNFAHVGYANGNMLSTGVGSSGPLVNNKLFYRINANHKSGDGLIENDYTKQKVDFYKNNSVRAQLLFNQAHNFSASIISNYAKTYGGAIYYAIGHSDFLEAIGGTNGITEPMSANNTSIKPTMDEKGESDREIGDLSLHLNLGLPFGRIKSTTALTMVNYDYHGDMDLTMLREFFQEQSMKSNSFSQELKLTSKLDEKLFWVLGANYQVANRELKTLGNMSSAGFFAGAMGMPQTDLANEVLYPIIDAQESNVNTTISGFGQFKYEIFNKTALTVGMRYDIDHREQTNLVDQSVRSHTFKQWQPKINLSRKFNNQLFTYVSFGKGYRSGGFNAPSIIRYPELYKDEYSYNYELGLKSTWLNNRIIANFSAFLVNFYNTMVYLVELDGGGQIIVNLGKTQNIGAEFDLKYRVLRNLDLYFSAGIINPRIIENGKALPDSLGTDLKGKYAPLINLNSTNTALQYTMPLSKKNKLVFRAEHEHRGKLYWHPNNNDVQPATEFMNLRATFVRSSKINWQIGIFVKNLLNTDYTGEYVAVEYSGAPFGDIRWPGKPRTFGINTAIKF